MRLLDAVLTGLLEHLTALGLQPEVGSDAGVAVQGRATLHLARRGSDCTYTVLYGESVPTLRLAEGDRRPVLVYAPRIDARTADAFRRVGVQFLDAGGNAWVEFGDVLIDVRGRSGPRQAGGRRPSGSLFTARRAQVILALLTWPHLWTAPQREVARAAGVSLGQVHNTLRLLGAAGYDGGSTNRSDLLDLWAAFFPTGLAPRLAEAAYRGDAAAGIEPAGVSDPIFVSGAGAVTDLLRPAALTLYVREFDVRLPVANRWRADGEPNIVVRRAFWRAPADEEGVERGVVRAPWPLVLADLLSDDDPRVRAAARTWRSQHAPAR